MNKRVGDRFINGYVPTLDKGMLLPLTSVQEKLFTGEGNSLQRRSACSAASAGGEKLHLYLIRYSFLYSGSYPPSASALVDENTLKDIVVIICEEIFQGVTR